MTTEATIEKTDKAEAAERIEKRVAAKQTEVADEKKAEVAEEKTTSEPSVSEDQIRALAYLGVSRKSAEELTPQMAETLVEAARKGRQRAGKLSAREKKADNTVAMVAMMDGLREQLKLLTGKVTGLEKAKAVNLLEAIGDEDDGAVAQGKMNKVIKAFNELTAKMNEPEKPGKPAEKPADDADDVSAEMKVEVEQDVDDFFSKLPEEDFPQFGTGPTAELDADGPERTKRLKVIRKAEKLLVAHDYEIDLPEALDDALRSVARKAYEKFKGRKAREKADDIGKRKPARASDSVTTTTESGDSEKVAAGKKIRERAAKRNIPMPT